MNASISKIKELQAQKTMENLRKNNMDAYYIHTKEQVVQKVAELLHVGDTVAVGGSVTLSETGVLNLLRSGSYHFLDRYVPGLSEEQIHQIFINSFSADAYICSSNAVTMNGELYNVDGNSNRIAALCFGPRSVILVVGCNKIVSDLDAAKNYVKQVSAPANAVRLRCKTYCSATGICQGLMDDEMTSGCSGDARICCNYVVSAHQRIPGRIKVILVGEELGY